VTTVIRHLEFSLLPERFASSQFAVDFARDRRATSVGNARRISAGSHLPRPGLIEMEAARLKEWIRALNEAIIAFFMQRSIDIRKIHFFSLGTNSTPIDRLSRRKKYSMCFFLLERGIKQQEV
jgi:hypothetical protein